MKIRHQPRQTRRGLRNSRRESITVPSLLWKRDADRAAGGALNGANRHRIGGGIDDHPVTRAGKQAEDQCEGAEGAVDHHHFIGPRRQTAFAVATGNRLPQYRQPLLIVAGLAQVGRQQRHGMLEGLMDFRPGAEGGGREIQRGGDV